MGQVRELEVQAGLQEKEEGEKPSRFFFQAVKERRKRVRMEGLVGDRGLVTSTEGMPRVAAEWYDGLFSEREVVAGGADAFLECLEGVLSPQQREALESPLSLEELTGALQSMNLNKSPGADRLTVEFYRAFWDELGCDLMEVVREAEAIGVLPTSMRAGLVTLLFKGGDGTAMGNCQ